MAQLKLPDGVGSASHGAFSFVGDDAGIIDTKDAPEEVVRHLIAYAGCREATDEDVEKADQATVFAEKVVDAKAEKADLIEKLKGFGVAVDGRATLTNLRRMVAEHTAAAPAAKPADDKGSDKPKA
jgi:hypothetical protein